MHQTIVDNALFRPGERVAIAASGGKGELCSVAAACSHRIHSVWCAFAARADSTVLAHVLTRLNERFAYGLRLFLLSVDEGIVGYRDDSLEVVRAPVRELTAPPRAGCQAEPGAVWR